MKKSAAAIDSRRFASSFSLRIITGRVRQAAGKAVLSGGGEGGLLKWRKEGKLVEEGKGFIGGRRSIAGAVGRGKGPKEVRGEV